MENKIEKEYIEKAEKWFMENLGEERKKWPAYEDVILEIAEDIKSGKELNPTIYIYDLVD